MTFELFLIVLAVIFGVFACVIVPSALYLRQNGMKGDLSLLIDKIEKNLREYAEFCTRATELYKKIADVEADLSAAKTRDINTQETIRNLGNKLNSRERTMRKSQNTVPEEREEDVAATDLEQLSLQFPGGVMPLQQQQPDQRSQDPYTRKFGVIP